jgi:S1-C subfamily serine protease
LVSWLWKNAPRRCSYALRRGQTGPAGATAAGFADVVANALLSVVQIRSARGLGPGVVFDSAGHVVTNAHVVAGSRRFIVTLPDGSQRAATLRRTFPEGDLAVVELEGARPRPAVFADSERVRVGEYALVIGNPSGCARASRRGSSARRAGRFRRATASRCPP